MTDHATRGRYYAPGTRGKGKRANKTWVWRGSVDGKEHEITTGQDTEEGARQIAQQFVDQMRRHNEEERERHDQHQSAKSEEVRRTAPKAVGLGYFEEWLLDRYRIEGDAIIRMSDGRPLRFYFTPKGYLMTSITYRGYRKNVYQHRLVFLLAHRWLPASIDHINRVPSDNRPENLRAATPAQQAANRDIALLGRLFKGGITSIRGGAPVRSKMSEDDED